MSKKYTIMKTFELPDDFSYRTCDCTHSSCPFQFYNRNENWYECKLDFKCPFIESDGWVCRVRDVSEEDKYIEAMDKAKKLVYEATKHYVPDQIPNIYEMRDATPEEENGETDYIHSIAKPTGIKFDEVK